MLRISRRDRTHAEVLRTTARGPVPHDGAVKCPNCGTNGHGEFCSRCGQKRPHDADLSLAHAWHHVLHETLHLDGRIFNTLKLLFLRPGQLTLDFLEGRRARHVHPLRLFLVFSAIYFVANAQVISPSGILYGSRYTGRIVQALKIKSDREGVTYETLLERVDHRVHVAFKAAFIGSVIANGAGFWLFFRRKRPYFVANMVTALHLSCIAMTLSVGLGLLGHWLRLEAVFSGVATAVLMLYSRTALRRVYAGERPYKIGLSLLIFALGDLVILAGVTLIVIWLSIR